MVDGEKMSKSKGNFYTIRDLVAKGFDPLAIRYALIATRYRESLNFPSRACTKPPAPSPPCATWPTNCKLAAASGITIRRCNPAPRLEPSDQKMLAAFSKALDDDLNIAAALAALFTWATPLNKQKKIPTPQARSRPRHAQEN